jgi:hypothetical protein
MGLDMYLSARRYVGNWSHGGETEKKAYRTVTSAIGLKTFNGPEWSPHLVVEVCVGYWRKANAIHKWFVENCQDGNDNCLPYPVSREHLKKLQQDCQEVLSHRQGAQAAEVALRTLPTGGGFFFGETEYDDYYWNALLDTSEQIRNVLDSKELEGFEFIYRASW